MKGTAAECKKHKVPVWTGMSMEGDFISFALNECTKDVLEGTSSPQKLCKFL
jgi:hypothetical protein